MTISKLATQNVPITAKCNPREGRKICKITPHYMAGDMGAKNCAIYHRDKAQASANYYIGSDGTICAGVPEEYRAWTSSSWDNDSYAITFECANVDGNGTLTNACYKALVDLCADICKRYGISPHYNGAASGSLTMHKQFAATSCPGNWLTDKITSGQLERDIKNAMNGVQPTPANPAPQPTTKKWVRDCVLQVGDMVKSVSCGIKGVNEDETMVNVPALGGWVPLLDVTESPDTQDGKNDDYLRNTNAKVFYNPKKVVEIDAKHNLIRCEDCDYFIDPDPLMALR